jgi:hypothetical protein
MLNLNKAQMDAAGEFANAAVSALKFQGGIHPATVVAGSARMAGTYLFRSFHLNLKDVLPGQAVLSVQAAEQETALVEIALGALRRFCIRIAPAPTERVNDPQNKPVLSFLETQRKLEAAYLPIQEKWKLSNQEAAQAVAAATALLIRHCAKVLEPSIAFGVAAYGFMEGTKTAPDPVEGA